MNQKNSLKKRGAQLSSALPFARYQNAFELLHKGTVKNLKDTKSSKNTYIPIEAADDNIYITEPDKKIIPDIPNQQKCDFLIYCKNKPQTCFIELKGENITVKDSYNPYDQIIDTIKYLHKEAELKELVAENVEKHAFIVSPQRQKFPKGIELKERLLWQNLAQIHTKKSNLPDLVHYVKVTKSDRYSNKKQIICSPKSPIPFPFCKE